VSRYGSAHAYLVAARIANYSAVEPLDQKGVKAELQISITELMVLQELTSYFEQMSIPSED